jgi:hypothetical protein
MDITPTSGIGAYDHATGRVEISVEIPVDTDKSRDFQFTAYKGTRTDYCINGNVID